MIEFHNSELEQAKAALSLARAYHAGAMLAARHNPSDPQIQRRVQDAVQQGRGAWQAFQTASAAGRAAQIEALVPSDFRD